MTSGRSRRGSRARRSTGRPSARLDCRHLGRKPITFITPLSGAKGIGGTGFAVDSEDSETGQQRGSTHMRTEILEQPAALRATIDALLPRTAEVAAIAQRARQWLFFARGTSDNAAVYGTYLIQTTTGRLASLGSPSVATTYRSRIDLSGVMAVGLSQSGRTQEIAETLDWARDCGASVVVITNGAGSPLAELADVALVTQAGVEQAVPATKTFTCQLVALAVLALGLGADLDASLLRQLPMVIEDLLGAAVTSGYGIAQVVDELAAVDGLMVSARGLVYSAALELALKIKEACYLHAMGIS